MYINHVSATYTNFVLQTAIIVLELQFHALYKNYFKIYKYLNQLAIALYNTANITYHMAGEFCGEKFGEFTLFKHLVENV